MDEINNTRYPKLTISYNCRDGSGNSFSSHDYFVKDKPSIKFYVFRWSRNKNDSYMTLQFEDRKDLSSFMLVLIRSMQNNTLDSISVSLKGCCSSRNLFWETYKCNNSTSDIYEPGCYGKSLLAENSFQFDKFANDISCLLWFSDMFIKTGDCCPRAESYPHEPITSNSKRKKR